ncbi:MAG: hypothetical protein HWN67_10585 [Candidatus Helarchaeota archaeon]|nr:hypothetical protein [Candidatus Helarchaeota archaeon]
MSKKKKNNENEEKDITKQARENIPIEVWNTLPDHIKKEIDPDYEPPAPKPIFKGASPDLTESLNRLRDGFEKIGLTLIGRMGEFATTLERVMMAVARIDKVENLVSEIKYFLKGLQKTLDNVDSTLNKLDTTVIAFELENIKKMLQRGIPTTTAPVSPQPAKVSPKPTPVSAKVDSSKAAKPTPKPAVSIKPEEEVVVSGDLQLEKLIKEKSRPKEKVQKVFVFMNNLLNSEISYPTLVKNLELTRDAISQCYKWVPTLYDIGKSVRKYKPKKDAKLSPETINEVKHSLEQWEKKILG